MGVIAGTDEAFLLTLRNARAVFDLGLRMRFPMAVLDIGGGFPIASQNNEEFKQVGTLSLIYSQAGHHCATEQ